MHYFKVILYVSNFSPELEKLKYGGPFHDRKAKSKFFPWGDLWLQDFGHVLIILVSTSQSRLQVHFLELLRAVRLKGLHRRDFPLAHHFHLLRHPCHEVLVVAHQHHAPTERLDGVGQGRHRFEVQVVGGLVQDQQVRPRKGGGGQSDARPLTARQRPRRDLFCAARRERQRERQEKRRISVLLKIKTFSIIVQRKKSIM